jgi:AraC-like DNA-binding protein/mannose-6-phosphate isomerase-like protein (cupin superfamily)
MGRPEFQHQEEPFKQNIPTYRMSERSASFDFEIRDQSAKEAIVTPHRHEFFQIHVNLKGRGNHVIGGASQPFEENSIVFILPYRIHYTPAPTPVEYYVINFAANFLRPELMMPPIEMEESSIREFPELAPFIFQGLVDYGFSDEDFAYIRQITGRMMLLHEDRRMGTTERIRGHLLDLIGLTTERYEAQFRQMGQRRAFLEWRTEALTRALRYIDQELHTDITLKQVSDAAFISPNYLSQLLKKQTGMAFVEWLTARRIERAQDLLAHTNLKVFEIANKVGFEDAAYFSRRFSQRLQLSPLDYRKKMATSEKAKPEPS